MHQVDLKNVKNIAKIFTLDFFKTKSAQINLLFNMENQAIYGNYDEVRQKYFNREKKMSTIARLLTRQERIISEMEVYMKECFDKVFTMLESADPEIVEDVIDNLPTDIQYSRLDKENPFALYCGYIDMVRPVEAAEARDENEKRCLILEERLRQKDTEFEMAKEVSHFYLEKEDGYRNRIDQLEDELSMLQIKYQNAVDEMKEQYD